jgi:dephospho-CoA kinase
MIGLTGGVGSGKSTVAGLLAERGAVVIDADAIAREVVEKGSPGFDAVVAAFGADVVGPDGGLDRPALAGLVFGDPARRAKLNAIVHPLVGARVAELAAAVPPGSVVVYDVPLLVESGMAANFAAVVVVLAGADTRIARLAGRGMSEADARSRMAAQATDEQRRAVADEIVDNDGDLAALVEQVDGVWVRLKARVASAAEG